jgi:hypothetical protein
VTVELEVLRGTITTPPLTAGADPFRNNCRPLQVKLALDASVNHVIGRQLVKLTLGSGIVCVGLKSNANAEAIEVAEEESMPMSLKPFDCTITIHGRPAARRTNNLTPMISTL